MLTRIICPLTASCDGTLNFELCRTPQHKFWNDFHTLTASQVNTTFISKYLSFVVFILPPGNNNREGSSS